MSAKASAPRRSFTGNGAPPEELAQRAEQTGKENVAPCTPFVSAVFNFDQVEGVARPADDLPPRPEDRLTVAEQMFDVMPDKPEIVHTVTAQPAYSPSLDRVTLPHLSQFESADEYFSTLYHELTHNAATRIMPHRVKIPQEIQINCQFVAA